MVLRCVAPHDKDSVCILDVDPMVGHGAASEQLPQSRYRGAVSDAGLVIHMDYPEPRSIWCDRAHSSLSIWEVPSWKMLSTRLTC